MSLSLLSEDRTIDEILWRFLQATPAIDEATVWLIEEDESALIACYNPVRSDLVGMLQPLDRGLISKSLVTGLPLLESTVSALGQHDSSIDDFTGSRTQGMMAAPLSLQGYHCGILSAVQLGGRPENRATLDNGKLQTLQGVAEAISTRFEALAKTP